MLTLNTLTLKGELTNRASLIKQLNLTDDATNNTLITAAYQQWGNDMNRHISGDYLIVLPLPNHQLLVCLSGFSSYRLFYRSNAGSLQISDNLADFSHNARLTPSSISHLLHGEILNHHHTLFEHVEQLACGQSIHWQLDGTVELLNHQTLSLQQKLNCPPADCINSADDNIQTSALDTTQAFNQLPQLAQILTRPISASWQLEFYLQVQQSNHIQLYCDQPPIIHLPFETTVENLSGQLLKKPLKHSKQKLNQLKQQHDSQYKEELATWNISNNLDFRTWLYFSFEINEQWAQKRLIAQACNKSIRFNYCDNATLKQWLLSQTDRNKNKNLMASIRPFSFDDDSIINIFDAMQRLMYHGYQPVTNTLFNIVPPLSAKLLKQHARFPAQVESFCCLSLTLDHLARHANWSLT